MSFVRCSACGGTIERDPKRGIGVCQSCGKVNPYIFISYSSKNQASADYVFRTFTQEGIPVWMAPNDIPVGREYGGVIGDALESCSGLVLLLTKDSQDSHFVRREVEFAFSKGKIILPVQLEDMELENELGYFIHANHIIRISGLDSHSYQFQKLIQDVKNLVSWEAPETEQGGRSLKSGLPEEGQSPKSGSSGGSDSTDPEKKAP